VNPLDLVAAAVVAVWIGIAIVLALVDARTHRLPNRLVLPLYPLGGAAAAVVSLRVGSVGPLLEAGLWAVILFAAYWVLYRFGGMGGGDVKLAGAIGLLTGSFGGEAPLVATLVAFAAGGLVALMLVVLRRARRRSRIAFGPFMLLGAAVATVSALA
jgi:leader peptidase (prepilin peptidase)/N-methyltransferase